MVDGGKNSELEHNPGEDKFLQEVKHLSGMYESWFLDYASYVILERAVPAIQDGLKPVQRRILHAMKELDDGRFNKVANIIGTTMQFHPHGDASIGDAIVGIGQKELLIETQGNWGDIRTGDNAAAPRYIEARLSKFALEVLYNPQTTDWQLSYDGRKKEPITLPVKFPLLLAQGAEGIAVGLSTKILPHNFCELIKGSIDILKGKAVNILPDFATGGYGDFTDYNEGQRGGRVKVRAKVEEIDKKTLIIKEIPFGTTTTNLIESIVKANDKGKIKIKKVVDNTAKDVEIVIQLAPNTSPDITIDALYAFTECESSIAPNCCVIFEDRPVFLSVNEILKICTHQTLELLRRELEIRKAELLEKILFSSLEKIFIENRIYRDIEECETWEDVIDTIDKGLSPFKPQFYREITTDDIVRLTEIKIKRISRFDAFKADELMKKLQEELAETEYHLAHIVDYAIDYYSRLLEKYGKGKERKTEIRTFDTIAATVVAANNAKLYVNRDDGFIGFGLKKDEYVCDCSDMDEIIVFRQDGKMIVSKIAEKVFVGKNIVYISVFKKSDERMVYNLIYLDGKSGRTMAKRFNVIGITRDKEYDLTKGEKGSKLIYFTANPNGEAEVVSVLLSNNCRAKIKLFDFDFSTQDIKGRAAGGNILTKYPVKKIQLKSEGKSTLGGVNLYFDESIGRLNRDSRGRYLGNFNATDTILSIYADGNYEITSFELTNRYDAEQLRYLEKFNPEVVLTAIYVDGASKLSYIKKFKIETTTLNKKFLFVSESRGSKLLFISAKADITLEVLLKKKKSNESETMSLDELVSIKGWKAQGNRFSNYPVLKLNALDDENGESENFSDDEEPSTQSTAELEKSELVTKTVADIEEILVSTPEDKTEDDAGENPDELTEENQIEEGYHAGDIIEMKIDPIKPKKNADQLGLFDD